MSLLEDSVVVQWIMPTPENLASHMSASCSSSLGPCTFMEYPDEVPRHLASTWLLIQAIGGRVEEELSVHLSLILLFKEIFFF